MRCIFRDYVADVLYLLYIFRVTGRFIKLKIERTFFQQQVKAKNKTYNFRSINEPVGHQYTGTVIRRPKLTLIYLRQIMIYKVAPCAERVYKY